MPTSAVAHFTRTLDARARARRHAADRRPRARAAAKRSPAAKKRTACSATSSSRSERSRRAAAAVRGRSAPPRRCRDPPRASRCCASATTRARASRPSSPKTTRSPADDQRLRGEALRVRGEVLERLGRFDEALARRRRCARAVRARRRGRRRDGGDGRPRPDPPHARALRGRARRLSPGDRSASRRPAIRGSSASSRTTSRSSRCASATSRSRCSRPQRSLELCRRYGDRSARRRCAQRRGHHPARGRPLRSGRRAFAEALDLLVAHRFALEPRRLPDLRGRLRSPPRPRGRHRDARRSARRGAPARRALPRGQRADLARGCPAARAASSPRRSTTPPTAPRSRSSATLVGYEIQGLARHALALVATRGGHARRSRRLVHRALALLDQQRYLEGSEEEVYASCFEVLARARRDAIARARSRRSGRAEVERKLAGLTDPAWRAAYAAIPENQSLLA